MAVDATELHAAILAAMDGLCYDDDGFAELYIAVRAVVELHAPVERLVRSSLPNGPVSRLVVCAGCTWLDHTPLEADEVTLLVDCATLRAVAGALGVETANG